MKKSKFDFQQAAERGLRKEEFQQSKTFNSFDPEITLPHRILPTPQNALNISIQLNKKMNSESHSPKNESKVLNESQMTRLILPQIDFRPWGLTEKNASNKHSQQIQDINTSSRGQNVLLQQDQSTEQNLEKKQYQRQSTSVSNQFLVNGSPRKRQYSFRITSQDTEHVKTDIWLNQNTILDDSSQECLQCDEDQGSVNLQKNDKILSDLTPLISQQNLFYESAQPKKSIYQVKLKKIITVIVVIIRLQILTKPLQKQWSIDNQLYHKLINLFKFKDKLVQNKIKLWTQMSLTKVLTVLKCQTLRSWNFIEDNLSGFQRDLAITHFLNLCSHLISNLELTTRQQSLLPELGYYAFLEQYIEYKKYYSIFVAKRTNYLSINQYQRITQKQKAMILTECIIMKYFIPNMIQMTENKKFFNSEDPNILFLVRGFVTILQMLFINTFEGLPIIKIPQQENNYQQHQIGRNKSGLLLVTINTDMEEFFKGTYKREQIKELTQRKQWYSNIEKKFKQIVSNLYSFKITEL